MAGDSRGLAQTAGDSRGLTQTAGDSRGLRGEQVSIFYHSLTKRILYFWITNAYMEDDIAL